MIRPYQLSDKSKILVLCEEFWRGTCADEFGAYDHDHTSGKLDQLLSVGACFVNDDATGFILIVETTALCSPLKIAAEVAWYVTPSARGDGIKLLDAAFKYCQIKGISSLSMMYMESSMPKAVKRIYDTMGLTLRETTYVKRF